MSLHLTNMSTVGQDAAANQPPDRVADPVTDGDSLPNEQQQSPKHPRTLSQKWTYLVNKLHEPILWVLQRVTSVAARFPFVTCFVVIALSFLLLGLGYFDGFRLELDEFDLWTPADSDSMQNTWWAARRGYYGSGRHLRLLFHAAGNDVLGQKQVERMFEAYETVTSIPGYQASCAESWYRDLNGQPICEIQGAIRFWNSSSAIFQKQVSNDQEAAIQMSPTKYPDGYPVEEQNIFGQFERSENKFVSMGDGEIVGVLTKAKSYYLYIYLSYSYSADLVQDQAIDALLALDNKWRKMDGDDPLLFVEVQGASSFSDEFLRGIINDMPLIPFVGLMMVAFTCFVFYKRNRVQSRTMLGLSAVAAVGLSVMTAYGICFFREVPFTPMSPLLPFILFGIGLDDAFVLTGSYLRTDPRLDPVERIRIVVDDVGISITLTTLTSTIAFSLGTLSNIPAVKWLCQYAFPSIMLVYFYQLTFFISCIVIDERRVRHHRMDCCFCVKVPPEEGEDDSYEDDHFQNDNAPQNNGIGNGSNNDDVDSSSRNVDSRNGEQSLVVLGVGESVTRDAESRGIDEDSMVVFGGGESVMRDSETKKTGDDVLGEESFGGGAESISDRRVDLGRTGTVDSNGVSRLHPEVNGGEQLNMFRDEDSSELDSPQGSKVDRFMESYGRFLLRPKVKIGVSIFFVGLTAALGYSASQITQEFSFQDVLPRDSYLSDYFDAQSAHANLNLMQPGIYFRNVDQSDEKIRVQMKEFINVTRSLEGVSGGPDFCWIYELEKFVEKTPFVRDLEFNDQLAFFLGVPLNAQIYLPDIRIDQDYNIRSSRCLINFYNVDLEDVSMQIDMLDEVKRIAKEAPINQGREEEAFFTSHSDYNTWEFYAAAVDELIFTAILGICSVTAVAFFLIPHWSAAPIIFPTMCVLYIDLIGVLNWGGVSINAVSYVALVVSIGLMVDFIMHVLLRYFESLGNREEKTLEMLRTMGSSVLLGGTSTFLATLPLLVSSSDIFRTVVIAFLGLVTLGVGHGLIILPVFLATFGTEEQVTTKIHHGPAPPALSAAQTLEVDEDGRTPRGGAVSSGMVSKDTDPTAEEDLVGVTLVGDGDLSSIGGSSTLAARIRRASSTQQKQEGRRAADPPDGVAVFVPAAKFGAESLEI